MQDLQFSFYKNKQSISFLRWILKGHLFVGILLLVGIFPLTLSAAPNVMVSIKPLHSLVAAVMENIGTPDLLVTGKGSEHHYQLRPDDAQKLAKADIVFWAGPEMEVFLTKALKTLPKHAQLVALADLKSIRLLNLRNGDHFEAHHHDEHHDDHQLHDDEQGKDLHFWLDPENARAILYDVAEILAKKDPQNGDLYRQNAHHYAERLNGLIKEIAQEIAPVKGKDFIVFHDAYQYFENYFDIEATASVTINPGQQPGVKRVNQIRNLMKTLDVVCVFSEPQFEPHLIDILIEGTNVRKGILDPLGYDIAAGPDHYIKLMQQIAFSLRSCLEKR